MSLESPPIEDMNNPAFLLSRIQALEDELASTIKSHDVLQERLTNANNLTPFKNTQTPDPSDASENDALELLTLTKPKTHHPDEVELQKTLTATEARLKDTEVALAESESVVVELKEKVLLSESINESSTADLKAKMAKLIEREQTSEAYIAELESRLVQSFDVQKSDLHQANEYRSKLSKLKDVEKNTEAYVSTLESKLANAESAISQYLQTVSRLESELEETKYIVELQANSISDLEGKISSTNIKESASDDTNEDIGDGGEDDIGMEGQLNSSNQTAQAVDSAEPATTAQIQINEVEQSDAAEQVISEDVSSEAPTLSSTPEASLKAASKDSGSNIKRDDEKRPGNTLGRRASISGIDAVKLFSGYEGDAPDFRRKERNMDFFSPLDYYNRLRGALQNTGEVRYNEEFRIRLAVEEYRSRTLLLEQEVASLRQQLNDAAAQHEPGVGQVEDQEKVAHVPLESELRQAETKTEDNSVEEQNEGMLDEEEEEEEEEEDNMIADTTTDTFRTASEGGETISAEEETSVDVSAIQKQLYATIEENNDLRRRLSDNEQYMNGLTAENEALATDVSDLRVRLEEIMPVIAEMEEQVQNGSGRLLENAELSAVIQEQEDRLRDAFRLEREDLVRQIQEMSRAIEEMESRIKESVDAEETANRLLEDREEELQILRVAISKLEAEAAVKSRRRSDGEIPQSSEEFNSENRSRRSLLVPLSSGQAELEAIFQRRLSTETASDVVENAPTPNNSESMHTINNLKDQVLELTAELKVAKTQFTTISTENEKLKREGMKEAKVILDDWKKTKEELEGVSEKLSSTETKVLDLESTVSQEKESFKRLGEEKESAELALKSQISELQAKLETKAQVIRKVEAEKAEMVEHWEVSQLQVRKSEALSRTQIQQLESELNLSQSQLDLMDVSGMEQENVKDARIKKSESRILELECEQRASNELIAQLQSSYLAAAEKANKKRESHKQKRESKRASAKEVEQARISRLNEMEPVGRHNFGNAQREPLLDANQSYSTATTQTDAAPIIEPNGLERELANLGFQGVPPRRRSKKGIFCCTAGDV